MDKRVYETSHPFIRFDVDLSRMGGKFWMLLGEARSKCDHIRYSPIAEETGKELHIVYLAKGVGATTAIEGNSLSEEQVHERIEGTLDLPPSKAYLGVEVDNMLAAYNSILRRVKAREHIPISQETLRELNAQILADLAVEDHVVPGEFRKVSVVAGSYRAAPQADVPYLVDRLCQWLETLTPPDDASKLPYAFMKAVLAHLYIEWIHPFGDGNGRLGRLVEFLILISSGVPSPGAHVLTSHYNDTRTEYYRQLNQSSRSGGDVQGFLLYAAQGFVDGLTAIIKRLHHQQEQLMWRALVDEAFLYQHTAAAHRQRLLAIEVGLRGSETEPIRRMDVRRLTPELAEAYVDKTEKTLTRDLNKLQKLGFIIYSPFAVWPRLERVRGMRPITSDPVATVI